MGNQTAIAAVAVAFALCAAANEIVVENAAFRLTLGADGCAQSLVAKSTGEECLMPGVRIPFARIRQDRPYDNEMHLIHPAKPMFFAANRISRAGDTLEIGFADEYHILKVRLAATDDYIAFFPEGTDYRITDDFGDKRRTEIDGIEFLRLPVKARAHFGACANVAWDEATAVAVMGLAPEVRIEGEFYNLDATFNLNDGKPVHDFFNVNDRLFFPEHICPTGHPCNSDKYNWYVINGLSIDNNDELYRLLAKSFSSKKSVLPIEYRRVTKKEVLDAINDMGNKFGVKSYMWVIHEKRQTLRLINIRYD